MRLVTQVEATSIGRTENISVGGMLVSTRQTFEPETEVIVRFKLPAGRTIQAQGRVVHTLSRLKMGIQFLEMKEEDQKAIEEFVKQASEEEDSPPPSGAS